MKKYTFISIFVFLSIASQAVLLTLNNADFEKGAKNPRLKKGNAIDNDPAEGWDVLYENETGSFYALDIIEKGSGSGSVSLNFKAYKNGNIIQHPILPSEATADTYGTFKVTMDLGTRNNSGVPLDLKIMIWDISTEKPLASVEYNFPLESDGFIERKTFTLSYDNTNPDLKKHPIALRFVVNSEGNSVKYSYKTTHWVDNVEVEASSSKVSLKKTADIFNDNGASNVSKKTTSTKNLHSHGLIAFFVGIFFFFKLREEETVED